MSHLVHDRRKLSRLLARAIADDDYHPRAARRHVLDADKRREVFSFAVVDLVVHGAIASVLTDAIEPRLASGVYSYRRGRSAAQAVRAFARYVRRHRTNVSDPRNRGLYVIRADVHDYGATVPTSPDSPLWGMLTELVESRSALATIRQAIRPPIFDGGETKPLDVGLAIGSPVATAITNLYLSPVDHALESIEGGFYARFGDDLLFAHADREVARRAEAQLEGHIASLRLSLNRSKHRSLFFNGAGRRSDVAPELAGHSTVTFLGSEVAFSGAIRLPAKKLRRLRGELRRRIKSSARALESAPAEARAQAVCRAVANALDGGSALSLPHVTALRTLVDDRSQLGELDRWIAKQVATVLLRRKGARAHRELPPRMLRSFGLPSLVAHRNGHST